MKIVNIHEAKTNLSRLLARVELGEEIIIANRGTPIAKLQPYTEDASSPRIPGRLKGQFTVPPDFNRTDEDIIQLFEGGYDWS